MASSRQLVAAAQARREANRRAFVANARASQAQLDTMRAWRGETAGRRAAQKRARAPRAPATGPSVLAVVMPPSASAAPKKTTRKGDKKMAKGRDSLIARAKAGLASKPTFAKVVGSVAVQIGMEIAEGGMALLSVGLDTVAQTTESTADDLAFPIAKKGVASLGRLASGMWVAKKSPELAAVASAGFSSLSGCEYKGYFQRHGIMATRRVAEALQGGAKK